MPDREDDSRDADEDILELVGDVPLRRIETGARFDTPIDGFIDGPILAGE